MAEDYGRGGLEPKQPAWLISKCDCCGCEIRRKPKAKIPDNCPSCRCDEQQEALKYRKRRLRRS